MALHNLPPEVANFPVNHLSGSIRLKLSQLMDEMKIRCVENIPRDYRGLGHLVGLDILDIRELATEQHPTDLLLTQWCRKEPNCTVGQLVKHLETLQCHYVIEELLSMLGIALAQQPLVSDGIQILPRTWWNRQETSLEESLPKVIGLAFLQHTGRVEDLRVPLDDVVRRLQNENIDLRSGRDIDCNYVISPDGQIVEGTGWFVGDTPARFNHIAISITLVGEYNTHEPDPQMLNAIQKLLQDLVHQGNLERDFGLYGVSDIWPSTSPGRHVMAAIKSWPCFHKKESLQEDWPVGASRF